MVEGGGERSQKYGKKITTELFSYNGPIQFRQKICWGEIHPKKHVVEFHPFVEAGIWWKVAIGKNVVPIMCHQWHSRLGPDQQVVVMYAKNARHRLSELSCTGRGH